MTIIDETTIEWAVVDTETGGEYVVLTKDRKAEYLIVLPMGARVPCSPVVVRSDQTKTVIWCGVRHEPYTPV